MIKVKISQKDSKQVSKVVVIDEDNRVLMLKRSNYLDKFAGEWDLPGGHAKVNEDSIAAAKREAKEETNLKISSLTFVQKIDNLSFYYCSYNGKPIKTSHEHTGFRFFKKEDLDPNKKFEKVALKALEMKNDKI